MGNENGKKVKGDITVENKSELKIGFIGVGVHAQANIYASLRLLKIPIHAVCTRHIEKAKDVAGDYHAKIAYDDYKKMLNEEKLDAVFVITDRDSQDQITKYCLNRGISVFVEKPLGMNEADAAEVAELSKKTGKQVMVGFMKRFAHSYVKLKEIMNNEHDFGKIMSFRGMFAITSGRPGWGNEVFLKQGAIHYVDLIRFLFGEVKEIKGFENSEDVMVDQIFTLEFENGVIGSMFFGGLPSWTRHWEEITVSGINGFAKVNNMISVEYHYVNPDVKPDWKNLSLEDRLLTAKNTSSSGGWRDLFLNGYVGEVNHFLDCVLNEKEPITSAFDNVKTMRLCDSILKAIE